MFWLFGQDGNKRKLCEGREDMTPEQFENLREEILEHMQSITLAVRDGKYSWTWETEGGEGFKQRIADARNYLLLLAACLEESICVPQCTNCNGKGYVEIDGPELPRPWATTCSQCGGTGETKRGLNKI